MNAPFNNPPLWVNPEPNQVYIMHIYYQVKYFFITLKIINWIKSVSF